MVGVSVAGVRVILLAALTSCVSAQVLGPKIRAGAARADITPDLKKHGPVYMAGFGNNRVATAVHDHLYARCLALSAAGQTLVLCGVDSIGLFSDDVEQIRAAVKKQLAAGKKSRTGELNVVVASTHDHEAPDTMGLWGPAQGQSGINDAYNTFVVEQTVKFHRARIMERMRAKTVAELMHIAARVGISAEMPTAGSAASSDHRSQKLPRT